VAITTAAQEGAFCAIFYSMTHSSENDSQVRPPLF
jgi:hypothetical protein